MRNKFEVLVELIQTQTVSEEKVDFPAVQFLNTAYISVYLTILWFESCKSRDLYFSFLHSFGTSATNSNYKLKIL